MLAKRIIACLDLKRGRVVKGKGFQNLEDAGDPVLLAKRYCDEGADEIVFLDIDASSEGRGTLVELIERAQEEVFVPLCVGGGIRSVQDAKRLLRAGADKIAINTAAVENPKLISGCAKIFGSQCVVVSIDAKKEKNSWNVCTYGGRNQTSLDAVSWAKKACSLGAGEILLTSIDQDGQKRGYDLELTRKVAQAVAVPVIASGGAGKKEDFLDVFGKGKADAALLAGLLHYGKIRICEIKECLKENGIEVRDKW